MISLRNGSQVVRGTYDIRFRNRTYRSIPVGIDGESLANLLQSFANLGYVSVSSSAQCYRYSYRIEWLTNGPQPSLTIVNTSEVRPDSTPLQVSSIQRGSTTSLFYNLPNDMLRTYHTSPQASSPHWFDNRSACRRCF